MANYEVVCVGSATVDHFLKVKPSFSSIKVGDKIMVTAGELHSGGGATNVAAGLSRLGLKTAVAAKIGQDHYAELVLKDLKRFKVHYQALCRSRKHTDFSTIVFSVQDQDRVIFVHKGASQDLQKSDLQHSFFSTQWIHMGSLTGASFPTAKKIAASAGKKKISLLFNPSLYLAQKGVTVLKPILRNTTLLIFNKEEAQALLKSYSQSMEEMVKQLPDYGPTTVIITDGPRNVAAWHEHTIYSLVPPQVKVVDTTGAGDAFTAGVLAGLIKQYSFEDALRLGQVNALSVIQQVGCKNKLLTEKEGKLLVKRFGIKVLKRKIN